MNANYNIDESLNFNWKLPSSKLDSTSELEEQDKTWQDFLSKKTPMGEIFVKNSLFNTIQDGNDLIVLHATNNYEGIARSHMLYASGGGLGACVYGVPLKPDAKIHNLFNFIVDYELPMFAKNNNKKINIAILAIVLDSSNFKTGDEIKKTNYMNWGKIYFNLVNENVVEKEKMEETLIDSLSEYKRIRKLLNLKDLKKIKHTSYPEVMNQLIKESEVIRVVYFETLLEYCFLFQNSSKAKKLLDQGELLNKNVKKMLFDINPKLSEKFSLKNFDSEIDLVSNYLEKNRFIGDFNSEKFYNFMKWRISHNLRYNIFDKVIPVDKKVNSSQKLIKECQSFLGFAMYRKLKVYPKVERYIAEILWNQWEKDNTKVVSYANLPKGEIGIIPSSRLNYKIYKAKRTKDNKAILEKELKNVSLVKKLAPTGLTTMRSPYKQLS